MAQRFFSEYPSFSPVNLVPRAQFPPKAREKRPGDEVTYDLMRVGFCTVFLIRAPAINTVPSPSLPSLFPSLSKIIIIVLFLGV